MNLIYSKQDRAYGFFMDNSKSPTPIGYPFRQEWFLEREEAIQAARDFGMIVLEDGKTIGQA